MLCQPLCDMHDGKSIHPEDNFKNDLFQTTQKM